MRRAVGRWCFALVAATTLASTHAVAADDVFGFAAIDDVRDVRRLVQRGLDPKALDAKGDPLLVVAVRNDAARVFDYLLEAPGVDLAATNVSNEDALMIAAWRRRKDFVDKLIARDVEVNRVGWTALHYAASVDAADIVAVLLDHAAYVDAESPNKTTPLMMAARGGFDDVCRQLVAAGADPTPVNERDLSASDFARRAGAASLADWLAEQAVAWRAKYGSRRRPQARPSTAERAGDEDAVLTMTTMMTTSTYPAHGSPGILSTAGGRSRAALPAQRSRFVTQSHAVSAPLASPRSLFIAATIALGLYLIGRRLSA